MNVIERYLVSESVVPRVCEMNDPTNKAGRHNAEIILHDGQKERFLCKEHAAHALANNQTQLAKAIIELTLAE